MIILTFDTTMSTCSALIQNNGIIVSKFNQTVIHGQSELILSAIEEILRSAKINYFDIDKVGVTLGPGSFTGIRVGIATARALGLTNKIKCMGFSTTSILAREALIRCAKKPKPIAVVIDARREEVYFQRFNKESLPIEDPRCLLPRETAEIINSDDYYLIGDKIDKILPFLNSQPEYHITDSPDMGILADIIHNNINIHTEIKPLYVRPPDTKTPTR